MRKIYFTRQEVKIGDTFIYKGIVLKITDELVNDNPDLFLVEGSPEEINNITPITPTQEVTQPKEDTSWKNRLILNCGLTSRAVNCLTMAKINTLYDLSKESRYEIRNIKNVGKATYKDIINLMNREIPKQYHIK